MDYEQIPTKSTGGEETNFAIEFIFLCFFWETRMSLNPQLTAKDLVKKIIQVISSFSVSMFPLSIFANNAYTDIIMQSTQSSWNWLQKWINIGAEQIAPTRKCRR